MVNPMDLTGKKILVTGAASGIGSETAAQLSRLGATVVMLDISEEGLSRTMAMLEGEGHSQYVCNLKDVEGVEPLMKKIAAEQGIFHGIAHCAGIAPMRPFNMTKYENVLEVMQVNFFSFVEIVRCLTKKNFAEGGSIVAMSSIASIHGKQTKLAYSASKAAMDSAIRCMICDLAKKKIRINSLMPSWVNTRMYQIYVDRYPDTTELRDVREKQYMGVSEPIEVANTIAFLLSDATKTITGTSILMDGGISQG
ncbi:MAG: SDR family oxidoreductase [Clostridia bacterium]|nr:SDR family oxidoreductase [Clostridia bacterium]